MPIPSQSIEVGKCYLTVEGKVRKATSVLRDGRVQYEWRRAYLRETPWKAGVENDRSFASSVEREVPCDWTQESDG